MLALYIKTRTHITVLATQSSGGGTVMKLISLLPDTAGYLMTILGSVIGLHNQRICIVARMLSNAYGYISLYRQTH